MRRLDPERLGQHTNRLYRAAWALCGSREEAEDLVQETFVRVLARPRLLRGDDELAYLMRVLRNTFLTGRRTAGRRPQLGGTLDDLQAADPRTGERPEDALMAAEIFGAIAQLAEPFRLALVAVDIVGLSYREAARALGAREATITTRLYRARQQVARAMSVDAPDSSSALEAGPAPESLPPPDSLHPPDSLPPPDSALETDSPPARDSGAGPAVAPEFDPRAEPTVAPEPEPEPAEPPAPRQPPQQSHGALTEPPGRVPSEPLRGAAGKDPGAGGVGLGR